ncbi:transcription repressor OFP8 [Senna tora]|uniref:Transcription repressor n=1 Tax=Senna tora TaxID=362788 RepID=A0A834TD64_9FABA|nr:transcription repressor OFP8 [Senna tora]
MDQNRLKMRISRMFRSSFASCRTRNLSVDVTQNAPFPPQLIDPLISPKAPTFPSICRPKPSLHQRRVVFSLPPRSKVTEWPSPPLNGRSFCPPVSPISPPLNPIFEKEFGSDDDEEEEEEGEDETDTLFSSKSLSSDSSRYRRRRGGRRKKKQEGGDMKMGVMPLQGKVKDTFAVVKRSSDPYNDFRTSMVEMIVEKQIFAPRELENLLQCFLSLNSNNHHRIIVEVFTEIWEALFSDWF